MAQGQEGALISSRYLLRTSRYGYTIELVRNWHYYWESYLIDRYEVRVFDQRGQLTVDHYQGQMVATWAWRAKRKELLGPYIEERKRARDSTSITAHEDAEVLARLRKAQEELDAL